MKKHFLNNWGWYGIGAFQLLLIVLKLTGSFENVNWFGILLITEFLAAILIASIIVTAVEINSTHKSPKE